MSFLETLQHSPGTYCGTYCGAGLREHFGNRSEKLAEFDLQPFRDRGAPAKEFPPPPIEAVK